MKKIGILLLILILFSVFSTILIKAQEPPFPAGFERLQNISEKLTDEEARREYLSQEWKEILLKNKFLSDIDGFFTDITVLFRIFFGMHYSFSLTLVLVIILWFFVALGVADISRKGLGMFEGISYVLGIATAVLLAQIQILKGLATFLLKLIVYPEGAWARFIVFIVVVAIIIILYYFKGALSQYLEQIRKKRKEQETETKQKEIKKFTKGLEKGAGI